MTRDDIICEADAWLKMNGRASDYQTCFVMALFAQHISALVAAAEREACAKVCEDEAAEFRSQKEGCRDAKYDWKEDAAMECSLAIRKRGEGGT